MDKKAEIRAEMKVSGAAFADGGEAARLWSRLEMTPEFRQARTLLLYMSLPDEVPTPAFLERWRLEKRIVLPLVSGQDLLLKEYSEDKLSPGYAGISEPTSEAQDVSASEIDLAIVPGQAFDPSCRRLGRGKGFYDRLLPKLRCPVFGVAYDWRIVPEVPADGQDVPMDAVITPEKEFRRPQE